MIDNETLLAISNMMDQKFKTNLAPIEKKLDNLDARVSNLEREVHELKGEVKELNTRVTNLEESVKELNVRVTNLEGKVTNQEGKITNLEGVMYEIKGEINDLKTAQTRTNVILENKIIPRLNTIESCYTSTYERYKKDTDRIDAVIDDVEMIKKVVIVHSEKLEKLTK